MMMNLITTVPSFTNTYAEQRNARFSNTKSNVRTIKQRWDETYQSLPQHQQQLVDYALESAKQEFRRRNPTLKKWKDLSLAEAKAVIMNSIKIDGTMQRQLDIFWVLKLLNNFMATMVVPIQVYRPDATKDDEFLAWDGQHTLVLLWLISTHLFEEDPSTIEVPVNVYKSTLKAEMRWNFINLNSKEGKKQLELVDLWEQMVFGVRIDHSTNPIWVETELKQQMIERAGLFVTAKKFGDDDQIGAISRLQEINKLPVDAVDNLCKYLALSTKLARPVEEKEIVMMAQFFDRCRLGWVDVTPQYIADLVNTMDNLFAADFSPTSIFWIKASNAYANWHNRAVGYGTPRFSKEPNHGMPFLIAQLQKSFVHAVPNASSSSPFTPAEQDLF